MDGWKVVAVVLLAGCGRGPGTLTGTLERKPFGLKQSTLTIPRGESRLVIDAQDQETTCGQKVKLGNVLTLSLEFPADQPIPPSGKYPLTRGTGGLVPGAMVQRVTTDNLCLVNKTVVADAADVELVEVRRDLSAGVVEADLRVSLTFGEEALTGSIHATTSTCASQPLFCDAD